MVLMSWLLPRLSRQCTMPLSRLRGYVADLVPGLSSRAVFAERAYLDQNENLATAIACAIIEVNAWINEDKDTFVSYVADNVRGAAIMSARCCCPDMMAFPPRPRWRATALIDASFLIEAILPDTRGSRSRVATVLHEC